MGIKVSSHYETKDIGLVATLYCHDIHEDHMVCTDPKKGRFAFRFKREEQMMLIKDAYFKDAVKVNPRKLLTNMRNLKSSMENQDVSIS